MNDEQLAEQVGLHVEDLAERLGLWCETCQLSTRAEWDFAMILLGEIWYTFTYSYCADCGTEKKTGVP